MTTAAEVTGLRTMQRFDLVAIPSEILDERRVGTGQIVEDIRILDGSKTDAGIAAAITFPLFFSSETMLTEFKGHVGKSALFFSGLQGNPEKGRANVKVTAVKGVFFWKPAPWSPLSSRGSDVVGESAQTGVEVVVALPDYTACPATLAACALLEKAESSSAMATQRCYIKLTTFSCRRLLHATPFSRTMAHVCFPALRCRILLAALGLLCETRPCLPSRGCRRMRKKSSCIVMLKVSCGIQC